MEPYMNRSSAVAKSGCGTTRKNLYQPNQPMNARTTNTPTRVTRSRCFRSGVHAIIRLSSKRLQVFDDRVLVVVRQSQAVRVAAVRLGRLPGVVEGELAAVLFRDVADEPHPLGVEYVVAAVERRPPESLALGFQLRRVQELAQRRHRSVVQVWTAQPDAIQRRVRIAAGLAEVREAIRRAGVKDALTRAERVRVRVVVGAIGVDLVDRRDVP